jgi:hypothetical protein
VTLEFMKKYGSCFLFPVTQDMVDAAGDSPEGLNWNQIVTDFNILKSGASLAA